MFSAWRRSSPTRRWDGREVDGAAFEPEPSLRRGEMLQVLNAAAEPNDLLVQGVARGPGSVRPSTISSQEACTIVTRVRRSWTTW